MAQISLCVHFSKKSVQSGFLSKFNQPNCDYFILHNLFDALFARNNHHTSLSSLFLKHLFPFLTFTSPRSGLASPILRSSAQHTIISKLGFSVSWDDSDPKPQLRCLFTM